MRKRPFIAAGLQCVPLLVAILWTGELTRGWFRLGGVFLYFWLVVFSWGLGNLCLGRWGRFLATWVAGFAATAVAALASLALAMEGRPWTFTAVPLVLVIVGGTVACAVDAWRTARRQNAVARLRRRIRH